MPHGEGGPPRGEWGKTEVMHDRLREELFFEEPSAEAPQGKWQGRPMIARDTPIQGGVYVGAGAREALVVDEKKDNALNNCYEALLNYRRRLLKKTPEVIPELRVIASVVLRWMPYDGQKWNALVAEKKIAPDKKMLLGAFMNKGVGKCRHQALLGAYLIERLIREKEMQGQVSVDRNYVPDKGGHAWIRYTDSKGEIFIIDSATNYVGRLRDVIEHQWFYLRPEDEKE